MKRSYLIISVLLFGTCITLAQIPQKMSYQGRLTDAGGVAVANGNYSMSFALYDTVVTGSVLWTETQPTVTVSGGIFSVSLGSVTPMNLPFNKPYWLGISVAGGAELSPRTALASSPYSATSKAVLGSTNVFPSGGNVGIGTSNPAEKLEVNGAVKIGTTTQNNPGTVRFRNNKFEGYSSSTWYPLNNEIYAMGPETPFASTVRNADLDFVNTLFTIPDTGWYLIVMNVTGYNGGAYALSSGNYDENGYAYLKKATDPAGFWLIAHNFFSSYTDDDAPVFSYKYISIPVSHSFVRQLNAGDQLVLGAKIISTGTPTGTWGITYAGADVIRIK